MINSNHYLNFSHAEKDVNEMMIITYSAYSELKKNMFHRKNTLNLKRVMLWKI